MKGKNSCARLLESLCWHHDSWCQVKVAQYQGPHTFARDSPRGWNAWRRFHLIQPIRVVRIVLEALRSLFRPLNPT